MSHEPAVVAAGHVCLDVIPAFANPEGGLEAFLVPGKLVELGPTVTAGGGSVSNTGLALHRLGVPVRLLGKVGADLFGDELRRIFNQQGEDLGAGLIVAPGEVTSHSIILTLPGVDRIVLHHSGANDTFTAADVDVQALAPARIFHFGYPPIMRRLYHDNGAELVTILRQAKAAGMATSLDMAYPDPDSEAGQVDWSSWLANVLPHVDLFFPSIEEIRFMLTAEAVPAGPPTSTLLAETATCLLEMGTAVVVLKLGDQGLYLRSNADPARFAAAGLDEGWAGRELLAPCYRAQVVGTTGAGDCTIAGFLAGLLRGLDPAAVMNHAAAVGAFNVERADATSGIPHWNTVTERLAAGWPRQKSKLTLDGWHWHPTPEIWAGPADKT